MYKLVSIILCLAMGLFTAAAVSGDWNSFGDIVVSIVALGMAGVCLFLAIELWQVK